MLWPRVTLSICFWYLDITSMTMSLQSFLYEVLAPPSHACWKGGEADVVASGHFKHLLQVPWTSFYLPRTQPSGAVLKAICQWFAAISRKCALGRRYAVCISLASGPLQALELRCNGGRLTSSKTFLHTTTCLKSLGRLATSLLQHSGASFSMYFLYF